MATATATVPTTGQLAAMTPAQQQAYLSSLAQSDPQSAAQAQAQLASYRQQMNALYLTKSVRKRAIAPYNGGGTTSTYAAGTTLTHNFPTASGAYALELVIEVDIKFTPTASTGLAWTAAGAYAWFTEIDVLFNGKQAAIRPYFLKVLDQFRRAQWLPYAQVLSGLSAVSDITSSVASAQPTLTSASAAVSKFYFRIPLNALYYLSPVGALPIQGSGTQAQVTLQCASTLIAQYADPMLVPLTSTSASPTCTLDSTEKTIKVMVIYCDGTNFDSPSPYSLDLVGQPTAQYIIDQQLSPLVAGSVQGQRIVSLLQHYVAVSVIIDGNQSSNFALTTNMTIIKLDQDSARQNTFYQYGLNNTTVYDFFEQIRHVFGQDFDQGVIPWTYAPAFNQPNPNNGMGQQVLNMTAGGWTDVTPGVQVTSVSSTNFTPRIETYLLSLNPAGLVQA